MFRRAARVVTVANSKDVGLISPFRIDSSGFDVLAKVFFQPCAPLLTATTSGHVDLWEDGWRSIGWEVMDVRASDGVRVILCGHCFSPALTESIALSAQTY